MKKYLFVLITVSFLFGYSNGQIKNAVNDLKSPKNKVTKQQLAFVYENTKVFPNRTQLSIAVIKNGKTTFYGAIRLNDTVQALDNSKSVYEIGSISKIFTSTILSAMVVDNEVKLSDPIQKYFEFKIKTDHIITLEELANHTSGLPRMPTNFESAVTDAKNPYKNYDSSKLKQYLTQEPKPDRRPGASYEYSNLGAGLLGYILSKKSKSTYNELLKKAIFSKYNMTSSTAIREKVKGVLVEGLDKQGNKASNWDLGALVGAGGILSNVQDLSRFIKAEFDENNKELELTRKPTFSINKNIAVGLAWHIKKVRNAQWLWHNGGTGGYSSSIIMNVKRKNAVIILSNVSAYSQNSKNIDRLCFELMKTLSLK